MKLYPTLAFFIGLAALPSCALSGEKKEEDAPISGSIPPPSGVSVTEAGMAPASLPEIETISEESSASNPTQNLIKSGDFEFRDPTKELPKSQDLAMPPASVIPASTESDESSLEGSEEQPLVLQP